MTSVIVIIVVAVVCTIVGWYLIGKVFKVEEKEEQLLKWQFRLLIVAVGCMEIAATLKKNEVALIGFIILTLAIVTGLITE